MVVRRAGGEDRPPVSVTDRRRHRIPGWQAGRVRHPGPCAARAGHGAPLPAAGACRFPGTMFTGRGPAVSAGNGRRALRKTGQMPPAPGGEGKWRGWNRARSDAGRENCRRSATRRRIARPRVAGASRLVFRHFRCRWQPVPIVDPTTVAAPDRPRTGSPPSGPQLLPRGCPFSPRPAGLPSAEVPRASPMGHRHIRPAEPAGDGPPSTRAQAPRASPTPGSTPSARAAPPIGTGALFTLPSRFRRIIAGVGFRPRPRAPPASVASFGRMGEERLRKGEGVPGNDVPCPFSPSGRIREGSAELPFRCMIRREESHTAWP